MRTRLMFVTQSGGGAVVGAGASPSVSVSFDVGLGPRVLGSTSCIVCIRKSTDLFGSSGCTVLDMVLRWRKLRVTWCVASKWRRLCSFDAAGEAGDMGSSRMVCFVLPRGTCCGERPVCYLCVVLMMSRRVESTVVRHAVKLVGLIAVVVSPLPCTVGIEFVLRLYLTEFVGMGF